MRWSGPVQFRVGRAAAKPARAQGQRVRGGAPLRSAEVCGEATGDARRRRWGRRAQLAAALRASEGT